MTFKTLVVGFALAVSGTALLATEAAAQNAGYNVSTPAKVRKIHNKKEAVGNVTNAAMAVSGQLPEVIVVIEDMDAGAPALGDFSSVGSGLNSSLRHRKHGERPSESAFSNKHIGDSASKIGPQVAKSEKELIAEIEADLLELEALETGTTFSVDGAQVNETLALTPSAVTGKPGPQNRLGVTKPEAGKVTDTAASV